MPLPKRKSLPHESPLWVRADTAIFFVTICCDPVGVNQLCHPHVAPGLFESVSFRQSRGDWWVQLLLLMPDHLHGLISFPADQAMVGVFAAWKEFTAKQLGLNWQRDFFDHRLRNAESLREKADYILANPVRRGLVTRAEEWPYVWMPERANSPGSKTDAITGS